MNNNPDEPQLPNSRSRNGMPLVLLLISCSVLLAAVLRFGDRALSGTQVTASPQTVTPRGDLAEDEKSTIALFEKCSQSVAYISPLVVRRTRRSFFHYDDTLVESGTGSGFVWDKQGHVVTNFHVIQGADACNVTLPDGGVYEAALVGRWPDKDLVVLRIDAPKDSLVPISVGTSADLRVGQKVFAIGNPYGLDFTLTTGVVSALDRRIEAVTGRTIHGVIQTDAAINPGNSGGPLLDSAGRLIGVNTAIYSRSGSSAGIGFAVPVDIVNRVVPQLIAHGKVIRPGLGVNIASDGISRRLGLDGVLIISVASGGGAELANLRPTVESRNGRIILGDVIVKVGDTPTPTSDALLNALEEYDVGESVDVTIAREGRQIVVPIKLMAVD